MHAKRRVFSMFIEGWYGYQCVTPTCSQWHPSIFQGTLNSTSAESHLKSLRGLRKSTLSNFQPFSGIGFSKQKGQEHVPIAIIAIIKLLRLGESDEYCQLILDICTGRSLHFLYVWKPRGFYSSYWDAAHLKKGKTAPKGRWFVGVVVVVVVVVVGRLWWEILQKVSTNAGLGFGPMSSSSVEVALVLTQVSSVIHFVILGQWWMESLGWSKVESTIGMMSFPTRYSTWASKAGWHQDRRFLC